jgi:hypothetical protein
VRLVKTAADHRVFQISKREKRLLFEVLKLYPLIPAVQHRLSRTADEEAIAEEQRLLEEALAEQKKENKKQLLAMLNEDQRFVQAERGHRFTLSLPQMEWLLQVLNDIRVGSWLKLGCPDEKNGKPLELNENNAHYYFAMEYCLLFQAALLHALDSPA